MDNKAPKLATAKAVRLAPYTPEIAAQIANWAQKPANAEFFRRIPPLCDWLSPEGIRQLWEGSWVVYEDDRAVGLLTMQGLDVYARSCEIGILVDNDSSAHRRVTVDQVTDFMADYLFNYRNLHKVYLKVLEGREKLVKILESKGFSQEALLRDSCFFKGEYRNEYLLSCLKLEYKWAR